MRRKLFSGFTQAGHIVHVNLREEMLPYKYVVGQILRDKISTCRLVIIVIKYKNFVFHSKGDYHWHLQHCR